MLTGLCFLRLLVLWCVYSCLGLVSVMGSSLLDAVESRPHRLRHSGRSSVSNSETQTSLTHRKRFSQKSVDKSNNSERKNDCCFNGGICVLGSFCSCPKNYMGRYCQFKVRRRSCGPIRHGASFRQDCTLCFCTDGVLTCMPRMYDNCGTEKVAQEELEPEVYNLRGKKNKLHILPPELRDHLEELSNVPSGCGPRRTVYSLLILTVIFISFW